MDGFVGKPVTAEKLQAIVTPLATQFSSIAAEPPYSQLLTYVKLLARKDPDAANRLRVEARSELETETNGISAAWNAGDRQKTLYHAHRLISVALLIESQPLVTAAKGLQHALVHKNDADVGGLVNELHKIRDRAIDGREIVEFQTNNRIQ
jgi:hypothetical protein